jgi:hypothetical protein
MMERFEKQTNRGGRPQGLPSMSERQLEAYFLSRDTLRRIKRTSELLSEVRFARPRRIVPS